MEKVRISSFFADGSPNWEATRELPKDRSIYQGTWKLNKGFKDIYETVALETPKGGSITIEYVEENSN